MCKGFVAVFAFLALSGYLAAAEPSIDTLILEAKKDLALRLSMNVDEIELVDALETVWPDSSAGCPRPRVAYLHVLTEGARITLRADRLSYRYHSARGGTPFLCERLTWPLRVHEERPCGRSSRCRSHAFVVDE